MMTAEPMVKRRRLKELVALLVFLIVGLVTSAPCLCDGGEQAALAKVTLFLLAFGRLAWQTYRGTFRFRDYFFYFVVVIAFNIWADSLLG
jgi:hypothetical protein